MKTWKQWLNDAKHVYRNPILESVTCGSGGYGVVKHVTRSRRSDNKIFHFAEKSVSNPNKKNNIVKEWENRLLLGNYVIEGIVTFVAIRDYTIVMKYYKNTLKSLSLLLSFKQRKKLLSRILLQLAKGLKCLDAKGYCHYDIKPHNVFVNYDKKTYEIEAVFGDLYGMKTSREKSCTTRKYRSPEYENRDHTIKSDVYCLSMSLYKFLDWSNNLDDCRTNPNCFKNKQYPMKELLTRMIAQDINNRPDPDEIISTCYLFMNK